MDFTFFWLKSIKILSILGMSQIEYICIQRRTAMYRWFSTVISKLFMNTNNMFYQSKRILIIIERVSCATDVTKRPFADANSWTASFVFVNGHSRTNFVRENRLHRTRTRVIVCERNDNSRTLSCVRVINIMPKRDWSAFYTLFFKKKIIFWIKKMAIYLNFP